MQKTNLQGRTVIRLAILITRGHAATLHANYSKKFARLEFFAIDIH